jgi:hypothetical protein
MSSCWLSYEHFFNICNKKPAKKLNWAWFSFSIKNALYVTGCDGEDGRAVNLETQGCGSNFGGPFLIFFPIHTFIKFNIHKVLVEACLKNSLLQYSSVQRDPWCSAIPGLNPCPCYRPSYKLNCAWCTVELKVIGNLECGIKFYSKKKPRHFFYTIEYPYPPTNSVAKPHQI